MTLPGRKQVWRQRRPRRRRRCTTRTCPAAARCCARVDGRRAARRRRRAAGGRPRAVHRGAGAACRAPLRSLAPAGGPVVAGGHVARPGRAGRAGAGRLGRRGPARSLMGERLGVFGGTFDPPHVGHLVTAVNVRHELALDRVLLVVNDQPWQKLGTRDISPAEDRSPWSRPPWARWRGSRPAGVELDRGGMSYTADTLAALLDERRRPRAVRGARQRRRRRPADLGAGRRGPAAGHDRGRRPAGRPGERAAAGLVVAPGRGPPARGVEHRPAGPGGRRPAARLPADRRRDRRHRGAGPVPGAGGRDDRGVRPTGVAGAARRHGGGGGRRDPARRPAHRRAGGRPRDGPGGARA